MMKPSITPMAKRATPQYMVQRKNPTVLESVPEAPLRSHRGLIRSSGNNFSSATKITPFMSNEESEL